MSQEAERSCPLITGCVLDSLDKTLTPYLLPVIRLAPCLVAHCPRYVSVCANEQEKYLVQLLFTVF